MPDIFSVRREDRKDKLTSGETGKMTSFRTEGLLDDMERKAFDMIR